MAGKTVLVTGATAGIGLATARQLGALGAHLVVAGRDPGRTEVAAHAVEQAGGTALPLVADLTSMAAVRRLAAEVHSRCSRLDVLINNAGALFGRRRITAEGFERTRALNHLAGLLLTVELLPLLKASRPSRVVNVSSIVHARRLRFFGSSDGFHGLRSYGRAKFEQMASGFALARRLEGSGVTVNSLHPGLAPTDVAQDAGFALRFLVRVVLRPFASAERAARTSVYLASSPDVEGVTGGYFVNCKPARPSPRAADVETQERILTTSLAQLGLGNVRLEEGSR